MARLNIPGDDYVAGRLDLDSAAIPEIGFHRLIGAAIQGSRGEPTAFPSSAASSAMGSAGDARGPAGPQLRPRPGPELEPGMVLAIEPMVTAGGIRERKGQDGWAIYSADGSLAAHFEFTVAVTEEGPRILTPWHGSNRRRLGAPLWHIDAAAVAPRRSSMWKHRQGLRWAAVASPCSRCPAAAAAQVAAVRHQRRRRLPQRAAARRGRDRQRAELAAFQRHRRAAAALGRPAAALRGPAVRARRR